MKGELFKMGWTWNKRPGPLGQHRREMEPLP